MMSASHSYLGDVVDEPRIRVSPRASAPGRGARLRWLRAVVLLWLGTLALPADAGDFDPSEHPWGFGYEGGLTLRRKLGGKWELGISGGPNDWLSNSSEEENYSYSRPPGTEGSRRTDDDSRREGGFVAVHAGRTLWQKGSFDLVCYLRGRHTWSNWSDYQESIREGYIYGYPRSWTRTERDEREWAVSLGFRPAFRPVPWFSIEVRFGLVYSWTSGNRRRESIRYDEDGYRDESITTRQFDGQSFRVFGYSGVSSLIFIVWF